MDFGTLVRTFGYPAVVLGTMLQGEAVLLVCGFLAHQGYLSVWLVWLIAGFSASIGDVTYFTLGRHYGMRLLNRLPSWIGRPFHWARRLVDRHPNKVLLSMRFAFGGRIILPVVCGMSTIRWIRFLSYNIPTALVWSGVFVSLGYIFGVAAEKVLKDVQEVEGYLIVLILAIVLLYQLIAHRRRKREDTIVPCESEAAPMAKKE